MVLPVDNTELLFRGTGWEHSSLRQRREMQKTKKGLKSRLPGMKTINELQWGLRYPSQVIRITFPDIPLSPPPPLSSPRFFSLLFLLNLFIVYDYYLFMNLRHWVAGSYFVKIEAEKHFLEHCTHSWFKNLSNQTL